VEPVRSDRTYLFPVPPPAVWDAMARVDAYRRWWPWLRRFDAVTLEAGDRWTCTVRPPLPYVLRFTVTIDEVEPARRVAATVAGDIDGEATLWVQESSAGSMVRLRSELAPRSTLLRRVNALAPWMARYGHDWVLDTGVRQFRTRAL
jgi:uncharacterized protein YndB with AHSA1/START domain